MRRPDRRPRHLDPDDYVDPDGRLHEHDQADRVGGDGVGEGRAAGRDLAPVTDRLPERLPDRLPEDYWDEVAELDELAAAARVRRVPLVLTVVTFLVGAGTWGVVQIVEVVGGAGASSVAAAVVWLATGLAVPIARTLLRERIADRWARTWWVSTICAAVWVDAVAALGSALLDPPVAVALAGVLAVGSAVLGARWHDEHEVPDPIDDEHDDQDEDTDLALAPAPVVEAVVVEPGEAEVIEQEWAGLVAAGKNPIAKGSELTGRTRLPHGWRWIGQLDREESVTCTALVDAAGTEAGVALKLRRRATHVLLERLDDDADQEDLFQFTVITRDVLAAGVPYEGPAYEHGRIRIGDYSDGSGSVIWTAYDPTGPRSGVITGEQGSGKSGLLAALGYAYRWSGEWIVLFGDGDEEGGSSRLLAEVAHDFARGPAEVLQQLEGLEAMARVRGPLMGTLTWGADGKPTPITRDGQTAVDKILPCPAFPGVVWVLDEFHRLANDPELKRVKFVHRVALVVRIMRKYGGKVIISTQSAIGDDFGGDSALRGMIAGGNTIAMRTKNKAEMGLVADGIRPHTLPKGGGYGLQGDGPRRAMFRAAWSADMDAWAPMVIRHGRPDARSWAAFTRYRVVRELDTAADYRERLDALDAFDQAVASGAPLPGSPEAIAAAAEQQAQQQSGTAEQDQAPAIGGFAIPTLADVVPLHRGRDDAHHDGDAEHDQADGQAPLRPKEQQVLDALVAHGGPMRTAEIAEVTGLSTPDVSKALGELRAHALAHRPSGVQGVHTAGPPPQQRYGS